jgi:epoxyqueuosine reductase QueG
MVQKHLKGGEMEVLTNNVVHWLKDNGASVVGIANVERFEGAPRGHHPSDFVPRAKSVITFGVAILHHTIHWESHLANSELVPQEHRKDVLQNYFYRQTGYNLVNDLLDRLAFCTANLLESQGYPSLFFPATYGPTVSEFIRERIPSGWGLFSQRHAAVMAGLGEFGLNNVVVTHQYGPRIRFNSVITEAELIPSTLLAEKTCLGEGCSICVQNCPGAISLRRDFNPEAIWYVTPARTDIDACRKLQNQHYCLGRCIKVCPVG